MPMFIGKIEYKRPLAWLTQQVNANEIMQHPPCRRVANPFTFLVGTCRRMVFERLAYAIF